MLRRPLVPTLLVLPLVLAVSACGVSELPIDRTGHHSDGGARDAGGGDGAIADGGSSDGGSFDGGTFDGGSFDGGASDGGFADGGFADGGMTGCLGPSDCDDGLPCNGVETCSGGICHAGTPPSCPSDSIACTAESCDDATGSCISTPDSSACAANEICDPAAGCKAKPCGSDAACDDGVFCDGVERCVAGVCEPATPVVCDDGLDCTVDGCDEAMDRCAFRPNDAFCNDGLFCDGVEVCDASAGCLTTQAPTCDDANACTVDSCSDAAGMCVTSIRDRDSDGYSDGTCGGNDCNDTNAGVNPGASESCLDFVDNDCDGQTDCVDSDCRGVGVCALCRPREIACFRFRIALDTDCDGLPGCMDPDCAGARGCR